MHPFASSYVLSKGKDMMWWRKQGQAGCVLQKPAEAERKYIIHLMSRPIRVSDNDPILAQMSDLFSSRRRFSTSPLNLSLY